MHPIRISGFLVLLASAHPAMSADMCVADGRDYSSGATICQPAIVDGAAVNRLFSCNDGTWTDAGGVCPDDFAYFCRIGPHAVGIGERLLLGAGPSHLECTFPGVLVLDQDALPQAETGIPSALVRRVQSYLSDEGAALDCSVDTCSGLVDQQTLAAIAAHIRMNFDRLLPEERTALGVSSVNEIDATIMTRSPFDILPVFATVFDVPSL